MKQNQKTYLDLAEVLDCSLPTAKRLMSREEISLTRLFKILDWLDLSLQQIEEIAEKTSKNVRVPFTEEQERFFSKEPGYLSYLTLLHMGQSPESISSKHGLSAKANDRYLTRLERLGLIKLNSKGIVQTMYREMPSMNKTGPLIRAQYKGLIDHGHKIFGRIIERKLSGFSSDRGPEAGFSMSITELSLEAYQEYSRDLDQLMEKLKRRADLDSKYIEKDKLKTAILYHSSALVDSKSAEAEEASYIFGRIE